MRGVSNRDMLLNLSRESILSIKACKRYYREYFDPQFHDRQFKNELIQILMGYIQNLQIQLNEAHKLLRTLQEKYVRETEEFLKEKHETISALRNDLENRKQNNIYDPVLQFLETIQLKKWINQMKVRVFEDISGILQVKQKLYKLQKIARKGKFPKSKAKPFWRRIICRVFKT